MSDDPSQSPQPLQKIIEDESKTPKYTPLLQTIKKDFDCSQKFLIIYGLAATLFDISKKDNIKINVSPKYMFIDQNLLPFIDREKLKFDSDNQDPKDFVFINAKYKQFLPTEVITNEIPSENQDERTKGDVFIFGSICFALFKAVLSFNIEEEMKDYFQDIIPACIFDLIKSCWEVDIIKRPTFSDILQIMSRQDFIDEIDNIDIDAFKEYQKKVVDKQFIQDVKLNFTFDLTKIPKAEIRELEDFTITRQIGEGGFGKVSLAIDKKNDDKKVAMKQLNQSFEDSTIQEQIRVYREVEILAGTNNYAVQKLYGVIIGDNSKNIPTSILTPYEENGGLNSVIKRKSKQFDFTQKFICMYGIAAGVYYLHSKNIMHRDIKTENVLMNADLEPIITDFGLSKQVHDYNNLFQSMAQTGSILYMAPELLDGNQDSEYSLYDARLSDVYAFGNVVYNIFTGKRPYSDIPNAQKVSLNISNGILPKTPNGFPHALDLLLKACGSKIPENRPTFEEILKIIGNPEFINHLGQKVDMKRFEAYQKKVVDNSFIIKNDNIIDDDDDDEENLNLPEIPKEQKRSKADFEVISKPSEDSDPFFITAEVNDTHFGGQYSYYQLKRDYFNDSEIIQYYVSMLQVMYNSNHPAINHPYAFIRGTPQVTFKEDAESIFDIFPRIRSPPFILFPFMKYGNLKTYQDDLTMTQKFIILYGIAAAMYYLHDNDMAHLNLNPENILLNDRLEPIINLDITSRQKSNKEDLFYLLPAFSFPYVAPELLNFRDNKAITEIDEEMSDVYSFAMIAYFLFSGFEPWNSCTGYQSIYTKTLNNERPMIENLIPQPFSKLIQDCWYTQQLKRPKFKVILSRIGSSDFIRSIEELDVGAFQRYQKTVVDEEFIFPISLYSIRKYEDFEIGQMIGTGMFGSVRLATDKINGAKLASKEIPYNEDEEKNEKFLDREIKILSSVNFPSIVSLYGIIKPEGERKETIILFPFAPNGDLEKMINKENSDKKPREWSYTQKCIVMYGVAMGMYKLHEAEVIHRDLKPQNILINQDFEPWITDFGLSKYVDQNQTMYQSMTVGTPAYMAPEAFNDDGEEAKEYNGKCADVFSFGILTYFLMTGMQPWAASKNPFALIAKITRGERPIIPEHVSESMKNLIESCWNQSPEQRPTFKQIVEKISDPAFFNSSKRKFNDFQFYKYQVKLGELEFIKYNDEQIREFQNMSGMALTLSRDSSSTRLSPALAVHNLAEKGNPESQYMYGCMLRDGKDIPRDLNEAAVYFKKASDNGNLDALVAYALCLKEGSGVEKNEEEALRLMNIASEKDNLDAQIILAGWYIKDKPRKYGLAYDLLKRAEAKHHPDASAMIGSLMEKKKLGTVPSKEEVMNMYKKSCDMASPEGMYHMATFYHYGRGVEPNPTEAARLYNLAAKNANANQGPAAYSLSILYEEIGDYSKAFSTAEYYREQGMFEGYLRCADLYERGIGVQKDQNKAKEYYEIAKDSKFVKEQMIIGLLYSRHKGVPQDKEKAFYWTEISANNGSPAAQANLASYYLDGFGCKQNLDQAEYWGNKGAEQGSDHAYSILARMYKVKGDEAKELDCLEKASNLGSERALVELGKKYKELKRYDDAIKCFKEAAESRVPMGLFLYGKELITGKHAPLNISEGVSLIESSAQMGCREALKKIIGIYTNGEKDIKPDAQKVAKYQEIQNKFSRRRSTYSPAEKP